MGSDEDEAVQSGTVRAPGAFYPIESDPQDPEQQLAIWAIENGIEWSARRQDDGSWRAVVTHTSGGIERSAEATGPSAGSALQSACASLGDTYGPMAAELARRVAASDME